MLSFTEWLDESYEFKHEHRPYGHDKEYSFKDHRGTHYSVYIGKVTGHAGHHVVFGNKDATGGVHYDQTHDQGTHARHIFSTVHHILKHHANTNPDVKKYVFASSKKRMDTNGDREESSRNRLYRKMTKKLGGRSVSNWGDVDHHIPAHKLKES